MVEERWDHYEEDSSKHRDWHVVLGALVSIHVNVKIHVVELVSYFLGLKVISVVVEDLGEDDWDEENNNTECESNSLVCSISKDRLGMPDGELSTAGNNSLDVTNVNSSDGEVPGPVLLELLEVVGELFSCFWEASSSKNESDDKHEGNSKHNSSEEDKDLQVVED